MPLIESESFLLLKEFNTVRSISHLFPDSKMTLLPIMAFGFHLSQLLESRLQWPDGMHTNRQTSG